jgi:cholesterol oxidase
MAPSRYDLIVIGAGFGGAVCACRAAQAGRRVLVLERGRRMTSERYEQLAQGRLPVFHTEESLGLLELHRLSGLIALTASAVGGGSNIYTAVTIRPPPEVFERHWPTGITYEALAPLYDRVQAMIAPTPIPRPLSRTAALETIAGRMNAAAARLPLSMDWPDDAAELQRPPATNGVYRELATWLQGGRAARKRTLSQTYLAEAESRRAGAAEIRPLHEVTAITPHRRGYRVEYRAAVEESAAGGMAVALDGHAFSDRMAAQGRGHVTAERVVLAAGTLGTVRLLLRCRDVLRTLPNLSPALGRRFSINGDFGGLLVAPKLDITPDAGPPVTGWIDLWRQDRLYLMETGFVPFDFGGFSGLLNPARWFGLRLSPTKRCTWSFGVMGYSDSPGTLALAKQERLTHRYDPAGIAFLERSMAVLRELADAAGASLLAPPAIIARRLPITVHPLGGAAMADSPEHGVVDSWGQVHGHPGLFVADGSILPAPTGVPPSMTIAALAERVAAGL